MIALLRDRVSIMCDRYIRATLGTTGPSAAPMDETQKRRPADPRLPDRREDAAALVIGRARGDLLCRPDEHLVAACDASLCAASEPRRRTDTRRPTSLWTYPSGGPGHRGVSRTGF